MGEIALSFQHVHKSFFGVPVLRDINIDIKRGHILGLIGENGAGKSTLMNILGGVVPFENGEIYLDGQLYTPHNPEDATKHGISFIHQELNLFTNLSIAENLLITNFPTLGKAPLINRREMVKKTSEFLKLVDLPLSPDTMVEQLSPGERQLVEVAKALSTDASIIIFDEPTTSLTNRETERLFEIIRRLHDSGRTIIYISHILGDVMRLADDIAVLRDGELIDHGPCKEFSINRMITQMVGREINQIYPDRITPTGQEPLLEIKNLSRAGIVKDINFTLHNEEILGVFGLMGSGRSELAQIIFGLEACEEGEILFKQESTNHFSPREKIQKKMGFVTENRREEGLMMTASVAENLGLVALDSHKGPLNTVIRSSLDQAVNGIADKLRIKSTNIQKHLAKGLSGGNQQKVVIGKWLLTEPKVLVVDEPTRGVDVGAKSEIYHILNEIASNGAGILFISSEIEELMGMCDRILIMSYGEIVGSVEREYFDREEILRMAFREHNNGIKNE